MCKKSGYLFGALLLLTSGCATTSPQIQQVEAPVTKAQQVVSQKVAQTPMVKRYKRKVAIIRFTNETNYGRSLMTDREYDSIGKQASDMLASRLIKSNSFLVFERTDLRKLMQEQAISGGGLIGVDTAIIGSVTEFGRSVTGKSGFMSSTKNQTARAKVDIRLIDIKTGQAFFSVTGTGEANTESGEIAGYGSRAEYDATLNDRAIAAAITDVIDKLISTLEEKTWSTDILEAQDGQIFISGGVRQGLKVGDILRVMTFGQKVKSKQSGMEITLPGKQVATIRVISFFGDNENNEGSVCEVVNGKIDPVSAKNLSVEEVRS